MMMTRLLSVASKDLTSADYRFLVHANMGLYNHMSDKDFLLRKFKAKMGKPLDLENPKSFNEKIQWLKLYDNNPEYTKLVDKYGVREYIAQTIGGEYLIPLVGGPWKTFDEIDFDRLPDQFVLKCTHDSGGLVVCKDKSKMNVAAARRKIERCLKADYYLLSREKPYHAVPRRIVAEKYMEDPKTQELRDYKFMCFGGQVKCCFTCTDRFSPEGLHVTFFDREWKVMPFERHYPSCKEGIEKPQEYDQMLQLAERLSKEIPFVRVDFYEVCGKIYFGEMTFYPGSGYEEFSPESWDEIMGSWIDLSQIKKKE